MRAWKVATSLLLALGTLGCERDLPTPEEKQAITSLVRSFLLALASAYDSGQVEPLEGLAAPRLVAETQLNIGKLRANDDRLQPVLLGVEVSDIKVLRHANAYVWCTETWDTRLFSVSTGQLKGHNPHSVLHSVIQLKKLKGRWVVLYRQVEETTEGPLFRLTPTPTR